MNRDLMKTSDLIKGKIPDRYDLTVGEMQMLHEMIHSGSGDGEYDALVSAFRYGFVLGARAEKSGKYELKV